MEALKEQIISTVSQMDEAQMVSVWRFISSIKNARRKSWEDIPEIEPDEWDLKMLAEIDADPECHEFVRSEDVKKILGIRADWN